MSGAMESRAAVFTSQPQAVEVYERGAWLPAAMLGWRHGSDGACSAWVRVEFAGVVEDAWVELERLRLPESPARHLTLARPPRATTAADVLGDPVATQQLPLVRDPGLATAGRPASPGGGRRRAPETGELTSVSATSVPTTSVPTTSVPTTSVPVLSMSPSPDGGGRVPGRHRAPAEQGRHRAVDAASPAARPAVPTPRSRNLPERPARGFDGERLTRPMRLDEGVRSARRPRRDSLPA